MNSFVFFFIKIEKAKTEKKREREENCAFLNRSKIENSDSNIENMLYMTIASTLFTFSPAFIHFSLCVFPPLFHGFTFLFLSLLVFGVASKSGICSIHSIRVRQDLGCSASLRIYHTNAIPKHITLFLICYCNYSCFLLLFLLLLFIIECNTETKKIYNERFYKMRFLSNRQFFFSTLVVRES